MNFPANWRERRNFLAPPRHYTFANYSTDTKSDMKNTFGEELFLNNFYLGPDPLRKNLADTIITEEKVAPKKVDKKMEMEPKQEQNVSTLTGNITNFFSGVLNIFTNVMFKTKPSDSHSGPEMALPSMWHGAKLSDGNKILQNEFSDDMSSEVFVSEMSDCRAAAAHCKSKLDEVRGILDSTKPVTPSLRLRRRPKKVFVDSNSVEDRFEDAFSPEDFESVAINAYIEFSSPVVCHNHVFCEVDGPKVKFEPAVVTKVVTVTPKLAVVPPKVPETMTITNKTQEMLTTSKCETSEMMEKLPKNGSENITVTTGPKLDSQTSKDKLKPSEKVSKDSLVCETKEIVNNVPDINTNNSKLDMDSKKELVESCEDKMLKLKLLLQGKHNKPKVAEQQPEDLVLSPVMTLEPEPLPLYKLPPRPKPSIKVKDKRYKNPNRCTSKRRKSRMKKDIQNDALFADEITSDDLSSVNSSPSTINTDNLAMTKNMINLCPSQPKLVPQKEYFNEVSGRFHSGSVESDDSFQIVFTDSPKTRRSSDCESEDSFIIFEESPDSCYTTNDVFGDSTDSEDYNSDSDISDSGCGTFQLSASLSKSVNNLADDSLYVDHSEDEVDCANVPDYTMCDSLIVGDNGDFSDSEVSKGLLLDDRKKMLRRNLPAKKVHFSPDPPKVHVMRVWLFAARQTRLRYWEQFYFDRDRFKRRIADVDMAVSWVLKPQHRSRVMFQRFMPWWNAQKRKEIAEKKEREAQEKLKEEERLRNEEIEKEKALKEKNEDTKDGIENGVDKESMVGEENGKEDTVGESKLPSGEEKKIDNDTFVIEEYNCQKVKQNEGVLNKTENNVKNENTKISQCNLDKKLSADHILKLNEVLDLTPGSDVLKT